MINKPFKILLIGLIVNLSIGILYVWGVFSEPLAEALGVDAKHVDGPYQTSVLPSQSVYFWPVYGKTK